MANDFYNRGASFNPDELADGDAIEAEFDAVSRGFDIIEDLVNANKAGYPTQTFQVATATSGTHAVPKAQMDTALGLKLDAVNYNASDILTKLKTVDGTGSGLDADLLDGQDSTYYRNASNINAGTLAKERLPAIIDSNTNGNASTSTKVSATATGANVADLVTGAMADNDYFRIRIGGDSSNSGWAEIATADDGNEPIYVRQYTGNFSGLVRTLTLLDGNGNTTLPGDLAVPLVNDNSRVGEVCAFARTSAPSGFLKCNGAAISRTTYAALFSVIGTTFGAGDGSTTFNVPDLRGEFIRGWDDARGVDSCRVLGSWQDGQNSWHSHGITINGYSHNHWWGATTSTNGNHQHGTGMYSAAVGNGSSLDPDEVKGNGGGGGYATSWNGNHTHDVSGWTSTDSHGHSASIDGSGGNEVRVRNKALLYCIKY